MKISKLLSQDLVVAGEFQAYGKVGLSQAGMETRVYGGLSVEENAEFKAGLRVDTDGTAGVAGHVWALVADADAQTAGLSIESDDSKAEYRALKAGSDAFFTLGDDKDMLLQGNLGIIGDVIAGGDIWLDGKLAAKSEFIMQDEFTDADVYSVPDGAGGFMNKTVHGYCLANHRNQLEAVLQHAPAGEAIVSIDGQDPVSIMGILSGIISGGSTVREEYVSGAPLAIGTSIILPNAVHDDSGTGDYKASMRVYLNGQRLTDADFEIPTAADPLNAGKEMSFNLVIEEDDIIIIDVNDANPSA